MQKKYFILSIIFSLITGYLLFSMPENTADNIALSGKDLFRMNCSGCHGLNMLGNLPTYPSLVNINKKLSRTAVIKQIKIGKNLMPPLGHLSQPQIDAIIDFLFEGKNKIIEVQVSNKGEMLVRSNCLSCHRLTGNDKKPVGVRMMEPAHLSGVGQRFNYNEFVNIINAGPCYMPSFSHFNSEEKESIYEFLKTLQSSDDGNRTRQGRWCMGRGGRVEMNRCGCK